MDTCFLFQDLLEPWVSLLGDSVGMGATWKRPVHVGKLVSLKTKLKCGIIWGNFSQERKPSHHQRSLGVLPEDLRVPSRARSY